VIPRNPVSTADSVDCYVTARRLQAMPDGNPKPQAVCTLRVDRDLLDRVHEIAGAEHRALAQNLRVMIEREIADHEQQMP
jgi:hypothetical protein